MGSCSESRRRLDGWLTAGPAVAQEPTAAPAVTEARGPRPPRSRPETTAADPNAFRVRFGFEGKAHYRDSEHLRLPSPFPFPPEFLPPGATAGPSSKR